MRTLIRRNFPAHGIVGEEYGDDTLEINSFDPSVWEGLFEVPLFTTTSTSTGGAQ